jgi:SAM-dependent methyltransferase
MDRSNLFVEAEESYGSLTSISDPGSCGEDLDENLRLVARLAPVHCQDCDGYHLRYAIVRTLRGEIGVNDDRDQLVSLVRAQMVDTPLRSKPVVDVLIAGAADTGILATCAHALQKASGETGPAARFSVVDICETPLALCRLFARRHRLDITTTCANLIEPANTFSADIIVLHSVLTHLPVEFHEGLLRNLSRWLSPHGRIVFSNRLRYPRSHRRNVTLETIDELQAKRGKKLPLSAAEVAAALDHDRVPAHEYTSAEDLRSLFERAGLTAETELVVDATVARHMPTSGKDPLKRRYIAALSVRGDDLIAITKADRILPCPLPPPWNNE